MLGIEYLINEHGEKRAVVIDLKKHAQLWEDSFDMLVNESRKNVPRESHESVRRRLNYSSGGS